MTVRIRGDLAQLASYKPGRTIEGAIKLASNEGSLHPLPSVVSAITDAAKGVNRYPDNMAVHLTERLAALAGVQPDRVAIGAGSVMLCMELVQATCTPQDEALFGWRSFEAYPLIVHAVGAHGVRVPLTAEHGLDLDGMLAAITPKTRLVFVCNPNNPTGTALHRAELERFCDAVPDDVLIILDEAYREYVDDDDVPDGMVMLRERAARGQDNIAVLRSFSKAYGLAGLRIGYCVASEPVIDALRKVYVPFSVNAIGQAAALASLDASDELLARCRDVVVERARVRDALLDAGYEVPASQGNFLWLPLGERTEEFNEHCLAHKVVSRAFAGDGIRITVGTGEENDAFLAAARSFPR